MAAHDDRRVHKTVIHPIGALVSAEQFRTEQLGELLRRCRERRPPSASHVDCSRRKPGLRQEDLAALLRVDVRHYRDFEHGRLRRPDPAFLDQVAATLAMSQAEREVLYHLAAGHAPVRRATRANLEAIQEWIDSVPGQPALATDLAWNILAWNRDEPLMFQDPAALPPEERNAILWMFSETAKQRVVDVEAEYPVLVGRVRTAYLCAQGTDPALGRLVKRLLAIHQAARWWHQGALHVEPVIQTRRLRRPDGRIREVRSISTTIPHQGLRLVVFTPVGVAPGTASLP